MSNTSSETVEIIAPCDMQEGYTFMAKYADSFFPVAVPTGGVRQGQTFTVPLSQSELSLSTEVTPFVVRKAQVAHDHGRWKDSILDCCRYGPCHPVFWNAFCFPQILMAQVLTRLKLDWLAERTPEYHTTFRRIFVLVTMYILVTTLLSPPSPVWVYNQEGQLVRVPAKDLHVVRSFVCNTVYWLFGVYTVFILTKLRKHVRRVYEIPIQYDRLGVWEDCCCSLWCACCTASQLARQTCDYVEEDATCCTATGLKHVSATASFVV